MIGNVSSSVAEIAGARSLGDLGTAVTSAAGRLGFVSFNLSVNKTHAVEFMEAPTLSTWTEQELLGYQRDGWASRDPLLRYAAQDAPPALWHISRWNRRSFRGFFEYIEHAGLRGGATIPLNAGSGRLAAMTFLSVEDHPPATGTLEGAHILAQMAVARLTALRTDLTRYQPDMRRLGTLSSHQLEILKLVALGKTNLEISIIVGSTRRAIDYHLREILRKLAVTSRTQAVALLAASGFA